MGQRIARLCMATVCCVLLTACPPGEEPPGYLLLSSEELGDRLRQDGFNVSDVWVFGFDPARGVDRNLGLLGGAYDGYVVDGCLEISLVLHPTGERIDNFDGPVCWEEPDEPFFVELEMTTLGDE